MELPPIDLSWFAENLTDAVQEILDTWHDANAPVSSNGEETPPELLKESLKQLIEVLRIQEWNNNPSQGSVDSAPGEVDISELGDYGLSMLAELSRLSIDLDLESLTKRLEQLALSLGLWVARQNGELSSIELVVNGIARIANDTKEQNELERIYNTMDEILDAVSPVDSAKYAFENVLNNPRHLLLLNRAIVATRSHSPQLMEKAFSDVADQLPDAAPGFFREGIEQIKTQGYPEEVREVMERYYREYPPAATLH
ncbi:MAG: hypothetical protein GY792_14165 [Gammaproteobacteria bacterium]|nr:hypothetical protein [Gammaproteobacteria bacterium]